VLADQHARLRGAMVELVAARGYPGVTVRSLARAAGVSTRTFYKHFANAEECFSSTYASLLECALQRASSPCEAGASWERNLREGLRSLLAGMAEHPKAARLALVDSYAVGPAMRRQVRGSVREFEQLLAESFAAAPDRVEAPSRTTQGIVAGIMRVARTRLLDGRGGELTEVAGELGDWLLSLRVAGVSDRGDGAAAGAGGRHEGGAPEGTSAPGRIGDERVRILSAVVKLGASHGYDALTVPRIRTEASVSRRSFDAQFAGLDDCLLEAIEALTVTAVARAERRAQGAGTWELGVYRATAALCAEITRHPALAQLGFVDIFAPGRAGLQRRERLVTLGAERLRQTAPPDRRPSELAAEASMAAAWQVVAIEIAAGRGRELPQMAPTLASFLVAPVGGIREPGGNVDAPI
jgi:AcrR family transcriptional regulator